MQVDTLVVGGLGTNCYLVSDGVGGPCAVIDPGSRRTQVLEEIAARGLSVGAVFITHGHFDHVGGVEMIADAYPDAVIYMHPDDFGTVKRAQYEPPDGWKELHDGDVISVGGLQFEVLHTPGHSRGSVTLKCGDCLFTGDTLFQGCMGRTDFYGGSEPQMMASLARLGRLAGEFKVLPGHMQASTLDAERRDNPYLRGALGL